MKVYVFAMYLYALDSERLYRTVSVLAAAAVECVPDEDETITLLSIYKQEKRWFIIIFFFNGPFYFTDKLIPL